MSEPSTIELIAIAICCLVFGIIGLYFLINFGRLFRGIIKNELMRKNAAAWVVIFFLSLAATPLSGGLRYIVNKFGWWGAFLIEIVTSFAYTLVVYNTARSIAANKRLKRLSFVQQRLLMLVALVATALAVNLTSLQILYGSDKQYLIILKYSIVSTIYITAAIAIVYAVINFLDMQRKRKFDEKELELTRLRELKAKAELDALHSKVNPHFLYNALNSIADLSVTDGKKARKMTVALADLFRYSINYSNNNYSTVKEEVEMAEVYLQIEKIRFEDKLNYQIIVDDSVNHYLLPRFLVQPLMENAVKHGLKATGQVTSIILEIKSEGDGIIVNVADTGPQFPTDLNPGYGVKSVYDKLDLLFPEKYEIHFSNQPRKQVSVKIQKRIKNEPVV
jgi:sensor histidine kinase YesM